ncbi:phage tail terminator family protein [Paenibacillus flagellatus]|uniref:Uncharacterized protein n=1 Tax=Paenibacillus flagellatus TaxID=2211139 RepID=A0A2V5KF80_9BACL|nr:hypothetical protein [Paenibacillus flagellatus]PYI57024.1 hypothetical protein DLM86_00825 [Paenibacillus flagellatus]
MEINDVRNGVVGALADAFPASKIHDEEIRQGLRLRDFFVKLLTADQTREVGRRYMRTHSFDVHFFADTYEECHAVASTLYDIMEYITVAGGKVRGTRMNHEIVEDVLHFYVDYDFHIMRPAPSNPLMGQMEQEASVKP